jgi:hypothetical protein
MDPNPNLNRKNIHIDIEVTIEIESVFGAWKRRKKKDMELAATVWQKKD